MRDHEKILKIMQQEAMPLKAATISKLIYTNFEGYKLSRYAVRDILWDKNLLADIVNYDKESFKYSLQENIEIIKKKVTDDDFVFSVSIDKFERVRNDNNIIKYKIIGDRISIEHCIGKDDIDSLIIGLVRSEIEQKTNRKVNFKKIMSNISKAIHDRK